MRAKFSVPIIGAEPIIQPATEHTKTGVVGVVATEQSLQSEALLKLIARFSHKVRVLISAGLKIVTLVEGLRHNSEEAVTVVEQYIYPLLAAGCDQLILAVSISYFYDQA